MTGQSDSDRGAYGDWEGDDDKRDDDGAVGREGPPVLKHVGTSNKHGNTCYDCKASKYVAEYEPDRREVASRGLRSRLNCNFCLKRGPFKVVVDSDALV